jgi:hypothetical protein
MFKVSNTIKLLLGSFILLGYFSILFYTPIHIMDMADMKQSATEHCPFMTAHETICSMTISEHIRAWQSWLSTFLPSTEVLTIAIFFNLLFLPLLYSTPILRLLLYAKRRSWLTGRQTIISLFSQGILHTKAY